MRRARAALGATVLAASVFLLSGCQTQPIDNVSTYSSVAPPLGVTPTPAANPTEVEATEMRVSQALEPSSIDVYVALGDSYASMGSASGEEADSSFCAQSKDNYPHELARRLGRSVEFVDASCQGSTTENIAGPRIVEDEDLTIEPQLNKLRSDADLVTLSLGGNDMDFAGIARCLGAMLAGEDRDCSAEYAAPTAQRLAELPIKLSKVHSEIKKKAPGAIVVVTGYVPLISLEQECDVTKVIGRDGVEWGLWLTAAINNIVKQTAEANGAIFVLPEEVEKHSTCASARQRWVAVDGKDTNSYPAHPTPRGQREMAKTIESVIEG
ncbi:SGNH/GDSL hydrolase family protein [Corynebacterium liangguodongii]|uniref:SGNH/GDSL hydrolase family protein n=1 Tax=Corynebacterium liangguodongii TaxID=2079535 RepID=A0A2S0WGI5_9CORY|nr:SGNH/GDSL hydrolase family protein [Corynebacterium liangguodongii]AWB84880.1 SGNH/GDSL hydrolase family protein [Corynebacterium liangguodongii]PWB99236.1 SGNH/GDSL hydrolase family protein [Corynebacterium liangguodongii]